MKFNAWAVLLLFFIGQQTYATPLGQQTYQAACSHCHDPNVAKAIGAPALHDHQAWKARFKCAAQTMKDHPDQYHSPYDYLLESVLHGKKLMVHGGLCRESTANSQYCTYSALVDAIKYMSQ